MIILLKNIYHSKALIGFLFVFGGFLRFHQYLFNRSVWLDEAKLALNIVTRPFKSLVFTLDSAQGAPTMFLIIEKGLVEIMGTSEFVLRLFPLACGITALFLFYQVARQTIDHRVVPLALGLFVFSDRLIYFSSEVKQYSCDVVIVLILTLMGLKLFSQPWTQQRTIAVGFLGALAIWFSHSSIFVLGGIIIYLGVKVITHSENDKFRVLVLWAVVWLMSFVSSYFLTLSDLTQNPAAHIYWEGSFMPLPPDSWTDFAWFGLVFARFMKHLVMMEPWAVSALLFFVGFVSMFISKRWAWFLLVLPVPFHLIASGFEQYPFDGRLLLYLLPAVYLMMAQGTLSIITLFSIRLWKTLTLVLMMLFMLQPVSSAVRFIKSPRTVEEIRPVLLHIKDHWRSSDTLYVYHGSKRAFQYYRSRLGFKESDYRIGRSFRFTTQRYAEDLESLKGRSRVWVVFSHILTWKGTDEGRLLLETLDRMGRRLDVYIREGAVGYLYDLS